MFCKQIECLYSGSLLGSLERDSMSFFHIGEYASSLSWAGLHHHHYFCDVKVYFSIVYVFHA